MMFQSAPPHGGRRGHAAIGLCNDLVSIRAPALGATRDAVDTVCEPAGVFASAWGSRRSRFRRATERSGHALVWRRHARRGRATGFRADKTKAVPLGIDLLDKSGAHGARAAASFRVDLVKPNRP